ncbi:MAG: hypothetical protein V7637_3944 [Mycobacteriales bacterium]|jgi:hypothetical protein
MKYQRSSSVLRKRNLTVFGAIALAAAVGLGVTAASAHGGRHGRPGHRPRPPVATESPTSTPTATATATPTATATDTGTPTATATSTAAADPNDPDGAGPLTAADYVDIRQVGAGTRDARITANGSAGTFVAQCGRDQNHHRNSDNFIVAPGVSNGAHHQHDYVGNLTTDGNSTNDSLAAAGTTCAAGDKSAYFWPVIRDIRKAGNDVNSPGGGQDGNLGAILDPAFVQLQFRGNAQTKVVAMPEFIRIITGDAKAAVTNFPSANGRARWSCSGVPGRVSVTQYPLCPAGQLVVRTHDFPSCWDGVNTDSANHRTHVLFPDQTTGACPAGTKAIPQLHVTLAYRVAPGRSYAVDTFPQELRKAITDHDDFTDVMPASLMNRVVSCINSGRRC